MTVSSSNTTNSAAPAPPTPPSSQSSNSSNDETNTRFIVSFYSIGEGIDEKTKDEFLKFLDSYTKPLSYSPTHWGREGEVDYCLALNELSASEQTDFIKKAKEILAKSKLVHTQENAKCDHRSANENYRMVVEFYSSGQGADMKTKEEFEKFLNSYSIKIAYEPTEWGPEGEVDYCLKLNELSSTEQIDFIKKSKELLSKSRFVRVNENAKCVHKQ